MPQDSIGKFQSHGLPVPVMDGLKSRSSFPGSEAEHERNPPRSFSFLKNSRRESQLSSMVKTNKMAQSSRSDNTEEQQHKSTTQSQGRMYVAPGYDPLKSMNKLAGQSELMITSPNETNGLPGLKHKTGRFLSTYSRNMSGNDRQDWMKKK